jgi:hypothetical protein
VTVTYLFYRDEYGGELPAEAFAASLPAATRHLLWLTGGASIDEETQPDALAAYKRALCAAANAFAECGEGQVGGFSLGEFKVSQYVSDKVPTGAEQATQAALKELYGTGLSFCGVA